jgi:hypothetical protein
MKASKKVGRPSAKLSSGSRENDAPFRKDDQYVLTLRLPSDINEALEAYIRKNSEKQRQKKNAIVFILRRFLEGIGEL